MKYKLLFFLMSAILMAHHPAFSQNTWPKDVSLSDGGKMTIYEPQPETFSGDQLTGRAAVSVRKTANDEPVFGAILFTATVDDSRSGDTKEFASFRVTQAKFSGIEDKGEVDRLTALLEKNAPGWNLGMSANDLRDAAEEESGAAKGEEFNNAAPKIIYSNKPATLVVLDGEPKVLHDKNLDADKVANSPNLIFKEGNQWNLYVGGNWYKSSDITSGWRVNNQLSSKVKSVNEAVKKQEKENNNGEALTVSPKVTDIIVTTEPAELLQTDGEPEYKTVNGTSLLYVSNSPNEIFKDINTQRSYILIAGRWYSSPNMKGPWSYIPSDKLPEDFAKIPDGSDKGNVLANVAGTEAAEEAKVDAAIPQTAKVDKRTATVSVEYDGAPVFHPIDGTSLQLAENANVTVMIDASGNYFALDNGVWFISGDAYGPWKVANDRPRDIDDIPANSAAYNSKYVYIYDETPDYIYTGYTAGYLGSYYYGPTIVYGTGWHYRPWFHRVYYPRPITWGFGFVYDPWYGWNINWGYNYGFLYVGFDYGYGGYGYGYGGGWFGPRRYCPPYRSPYWGHNRYYGGYNNYYSRSNYRRNDYGYANNSRRDNYGYRDGGSRPDRRLSATPPSQNTGGRTGWTRNYNLYNNQRGVVTQDMNRTARVYRPSTDNRRDVSAPINNRYSRTLPSNSNRISPNGNRSDNSSQAPVDNNQNNNNQNGVSSRNPNRYRPVTERPTTEIDRNGNGITEREENNNRQTFPRTRQNSSPRELPAVTRPEPVERNQQSAPPAHVERPDVGNRQYAPVQRQEPDRRPVHIERPSMPARQEAPAQRPAVSSRPSAPQGGSSGGIHEQRGGRPNRR